MHRVDDRNIITLSQLRDRCCNLLHSFAEILASMGCHGDDLFVAKPFCERCHNRSQLRIVLKLLAGDQQRINHRVSGNMDGGVAYILPAQSIRCIFGRGKVQVSNCSRHFAVHLFRPRRIYIARAQTCFDMADGNSPEVTSQRRHHRGERITMNQHTIRFVFVESFSKTRDDSSGKCIKALACVA